MDRPLAQPACLLPGRTSSELLPEARFGINLSGVNHGEQNLCRQRTSRNLQRRLLPKFARIRYPREGDLSCRDRRAGSAQKPTVKPPAQNADARDPWRRKGQHSDALLHSR